MKFSLKELRARKNKTQKEVAEAVGISETTYREWEHRPGIIMLNNACKRWKKLHGCFTSG